MTAAANTASDPAFRRTGIGGSDAPPVLGYKLYGRTAFAVYLEKIGQTAPMIETERMDIGAELEDFIARRWAKRTGHKVRRAMTHVDFLTGVRTRAIRRPDRPWMYAHVDRFDEDGDIVEAKNMNAYRTHEFGEEGSDQVPPGIALQVLHQLACVPTAKQAHVAVLLGGARPLQFVIPRDPVAISHIETIEEEFWKENVEKRVPPAFDGSDAADDYLRQMYPADDGEEIVATDELAELVMTYAGARAMRESAEQQEAVRKQQIRDAMGTASYLVGDTFRISLKKSKDSETVHYDEIVAALGNRVSKRMLRQHTETKEGTRRFLYTPREGA